MGVDLKGSAAVQRKGRLAVVLVITTVYMGAEVAAGLLTGSLALLADAGHMLTDVMALGLALAAISFAERPATPSRTYGYYRMEVLAALANGVLLIGISVYILYEAFQRLRNPPEVEGAAVVAVATVGLAVNLLSMKLLHAGAEHSLNVRGAYLEVVSDMLSSLGVIAAGGIV
jgi:cobalt-zinc-cadmium efflux system protein